MAVEPLPQFLTVVGIDENGRVAIADGRFDTPRQAEDHALELLDKNPRFTWVICRAIRRARVERQVFIEDTV